MIYVVGSGPSAVSATAALLEKGREVTMLDVGRTPEPEATALEMSLGREPEDLRLRELLRSTADVSTEGVEFKLSFGSDSAYRSWDEQRAWKGTDAFLYQSFALAGLSNVWGASILPFLGPELTGWPFGIDTLEPHYQAVLSFMPHVAARDGLEDLYPLYSQNHACGPSLDPQAQAFLEDLRRSRPSGLVFGRSRLAVEGPSCRECGLCLYGCPYGAIYNSRHTIEGFRANPRFHYRGGVEVRKVDEKERGVVISAVTNGGELVEFSGEAVFLGCGVPATAWIVLNSLGETDCKLEVVDSEYFLLPFLRWRAAGELKSSFPLPQLFLEVVDDAVCSRTVHLQVYGYNDLYREALKKKLGVAYVGPLVDMALRRLLILQGYLHSDVSGRITLRFEHREGAPRPVLEGGRTRMSGDVLTRLWQKLLKHSWQLGGIPVPFMLQRPPLGKSAHVGGTFPMKANPGPKETGADGRLAGFERLYLIDSSVFPSIPASTITLSVMANAHRIASGYSPL